MDVPVKVFDFLKSSGALQDVHAGKRKKTAVTLTSEAARAVVSGHVAFFAIRNIMGQRGTQPTQTVAGNPGEAVASDVTHFNWSVVCELLQKLNVQLSPDHRMLLGCGDPGIIVDLLRTMEAKLGSTATPAPQRGAKSPSPKRLSRDPTNRSGAVSVDQGKARLSKKAQDDGDATPARFDAFKDLEKIRKKREEKLAKAKEDADRLLQVEQRMKATRDKLTTQTERKGLLEEINISNAPLPCYLEFKNRSNVHMCHQLVLALVQSVVQGDAQEQLLAKEQEKRRARELALRRKAEGDRLLAAGIVTVPRDADHRSVVLCRALVYELVTIAMLPETKLQLEKRERERAFANDNAKGVQKKIEHLYDMRARKMKYIDEKKTTDEQAQKQREDKLKKYEDMRKENEERARVDAEEQKRTRQEKELAAQRKTEEAKRKDAERMLYYAEQKARVLEARRANAVDDEIRRAREAEAERTVREERRQRTIEISKKLMEKEMKREAAQQAHGAAPTSLSPLSVGTGQRSGYTGATLGWKFLTDDERVVAELLHNVRAEPEEGVSIITSRMSNTKSNVVWFTDQSGRRHPLTLAEGPEVHDNALDSLRKVAKRSGTTTSPALFDINMSIALTLAARCHACDLAHHGITDPAVWHIGTDGASATQRVGKFGTGLGGPGTTQEIVVAVVRPEDVKLSATDIIGFALVDDGCPTRENREALLKSVAASSGAGTECCGVGHAIAACGEDTVVEVFVILFTAGTYTDKSVGHMAAAQFNLLSACAPPFLEGERQVSKGVARSKKDLYKVTNVSIGRRTEGLKQGRLLRLAEGRKVAAPRIEDEEPAAMPLKKKASRRRSQSSASMDDSSAVSQQQLQHAHHQEEADQEDDQARGSLHRRRLSSFFQRYAPDKVAVVDTALALNEGREDEMFQKLADKYGPEPTPPHSPSQLSRSNSSHGDEDDGPTKPMPTHSPVGHAGPIVDAHESVSLPTNSGHDPLQSFTLHSHSAS